MTLQLFVLAGLLFSLHAVRGAHNVTVDDTDPSIQYEGQWGISASSDNYFGSQHFADTEVNASDIHSTATFTFTGTAIYVLAPLWPYSVNTVVTVDSQQPHLIDMTDPSNSAPVGSPPSVSYSVLWGIPLENGEHTIVFSMASSGIYIVVDALIYTVLDPSDTALPSPTSTTSTISTTSSASATSGASAIASITKHRTLNTHAKIAIGVVCGIIALVILLLLFAYLRKRPDHVSADDHKTSSDAASNLITTTPVGQVARQSYYSTSSDARSSNLAAQVTMAPAGYYGHSSQPVSQVANHQTYSASHLTAQVPQGPATGYYNYDQQKASHTYQTHFPTV